MSNIIAVSDREALARFKEAHPDLQSVHEIARFSEHDFIDRFADFFACDLRQARRVHRFATHLSERVAVVWANIKDAMSPYLRDTLFNNIPPEFLQHRQDIPGYDRLFGRLDFVECDHARSVLGPAAYFVDLLRFVERHVTNADVPERLEVFARRPDLPKIVLSRENTFDLVPYIDLVIEILEAIISTRTNRDAYAVLEEAGYPLNLPFNLPLAEIRRYLEQLKTNLHHVYTVAGGPRLRPGGPDLHHVDREFLGLSPREYDLVVHEGVDDSELNVRYDLPRFQLTDAKLEEIILDLTSRLREDDKTDTQVAEEIARFRAVLDPLTNHQYRMTDEADARSRFLNALRALEGYDDVADYEQAIADVAEERLSNVRFFLEQTGLTRKELNELVYQDLNRHEINAGLSRLFYINNVDDGFGHLLIEQNPDFPADPSYDSERIVNLSPAKLDRIYRFLKLARTLEWSFADLDWALRSLGTSYEPEPCLSFDGVTDFASNAEVAEDLVTDSFTIEAWVLPVESQVNPIFTKGASGSETARMRIHLSFWIDDRNRLAFYNDQIPDSSEASGAVEPERYIHSRQEVPTGAFSHVAMSVDENEVRFFIDGKLAGTVYPPGLAPADGPSIDLFAFQDLQTRYLGPRIDVGRNLSDCFFAGIIKEVRLWNSVRTRDGIRSNAYRRLTGQEADLAGYWPLVETITGRLHDWTDHDHHLQAGESGFLSQPTWSQADLVLDPLPRMRAYTFNGVDQILARADVVGIGTPSSMTIEAWVDVSEAVDGCIVFIGTGQNAVVFYLGIDGEGNVVVYSELDGENRFVRTDASLVPGEPTHLAVTVGAASIECFVDGESTDVTEMDVGEFVRPAASGIHVGGVTGRFFSGAVWELRVWRVSRGPEQIEENRLHSLPGDDRHGLVGYWPLDGVEGTTTGEIGSAVAPDHSVNHNDLLLGGVREAFMPERVLVAELPGGKPVSVRGTILDFDGDNDVISLANEDGSGLGRFDRFTLEFWFRAEDVKRLSVDGANAEQILFTQGDQEAGISVYLSGGSIVVQTWCAGVDGDNVRETSVTSDQLSSGLWYHLAVVHAETRLDRHATLSVYLDGDLVAERDDSFPLSPVGSAFVGGVGYVDGTSRTLSGFIDKRTRHASHYFHGQINDLRLWSVARDQSAIRDGRFNAPPPDAEHLVTHLPIDDGRGRMVADQARGTGRCTAFTSMGTIQRRNVAAVTEDVVTDLENVFSHYAGSGPAVLTWKDYVYVGKIAVSHEQAGIGVTFLSRYPELDNHFYWIRRSALHPTFHLSANPGSRHAFSGTTDSGIVPNPGVLYRFRVEVRDVVTGNAGGGTEIKAKIWEDASEEPAGYSIDARDDGDNRLVAGTVGIWSFGPGDKRFDDLRLFTGGTVGQDAAIRLLDETSEGYGTGDRPVGWITTSARVLHGAEAELFAVHQVVTDSVLCTDETRDDVHSHYAPLSPEVDPRQWTDYEYSGRMYVTDEQGGVGVTFFSGFPTDASYYTLYKANRRRRFSLGAVGARLGSSEYEIADVEVRSNRWYRFRIRVAHEATTSTEGDGEGATTIQARVWEDGATEPETFQREVVDDRRPLTAGTIGVWSAGAGTKYYDDLRVVRLSAETEGGQLLLAEEFDSYANGDNPTSWFSSGPHFSTSESPGLFHVRHLGNRVFGPRADVVAESAHTHYMPVDHDVLSWRNLVYTGRMFVGDATCNIGVTVYSRYPEAEDRYYALRRTMRRPSFHLAVHPEGLESLQGALSDAEVSTEIDTWYRFRVVVRSHRAEDGRGYTAIRGRVWKDGDVEPDGFQLEAFDSSEVRIDAGAVGVWGAGGDIGYVDDLRVSRDVLPQEDFEGYEPGDTPSVWVTHGGQFSVVSLDERMVLGTTEASAQPVRATAESGGSDLQSLSQYEYTGRMRIAAQDGGVGVTFFDQSAADHTYYLLAREARVDASFRITSHPDNRLSLDAADTNVVPEVGVWYSFRILVEHVPERRPRHDERGATFIKAKIWKTDEAEPGVFQVEIGDHHRPIEFGTVGVWTNGPGAKYFDELYASRLFPLFDKDFEEYAIGEHPTGWVDTATRSRFEADDTLLLTREYEDNRPGWTTADDYPLLLNPLALRFRGSQYLAVADVAAPPQDRFTIEAVVRIESPSDSSPSTAGPIVSQGWSDGRESDFWFGLDTDGHLTLANVTANTSVSSVAAIATGQWVHVAVVVDGTSVKFFADGEPDLSGTQTLSAPVQLGGMDLEVGRDMRDAYFLGLIQEVRLWSTERDDAQIRAASYVGPVQLVARHQSELFAYWPLLERDGVLTEDLSATSPDNAYHLMLGGLESARFPQLVDDPFRSEGPFWHPDREALVFDGGFHTLFQEEFDVGETIQRRTVEVLFRIDDVNVSSRRQVIFQEGNGATGLIVYVYAGRLYFGAYAAPLWQGTWIEADRIQSGRWHHAAMVLDARKEMRPGSVRALLDGRLIDAGEGTQIVGNPGFFALGGAGLDVRFHDGGTTDEGPQHYLKGQVRELRIWNTARTTEELLKYRFYLAEESVSGEELELGRDGLALWWSPDLGFGEHGGVGDRLTAIGSLPTYPLPRVRLDADVLTQLATVSRLNARHDLPVDRLTSLWYDIKHTGKEQGRTLYDEVFNEDAGAAPERWPYFLKPTRWNVRGTGSHRMDRELRARLMSSLRVTSGALNALVDRMSGADATIVVLDQGYLMQLHRLTSLPRVFRITDAEIVRLLELMALHQVDTLAAVEAVSEQLSSLSEVGLNISEWDLFTNDVQSAGASITVDATSVRNLSDDLRSQLADFTVSPELFVSQWVSQSDAQRVFDFFETHGFVDRVEMATDPLAPLIGTVTAAYRHPRTDDELAMVADQFAELTGPSGLDWAASFRALGEDAFLRLRNAGIVDNHGFVTVSDPDSYSDTRLRLILGESPSVVDVANVRATIEQRWVSQTTLGNLLVERRGAFDQAIVVALSGMFDADSDVTAVVANALSEEMTPLEFLTLMLSIEDDEALPGQIVDIPSGYLYRIGKLLALIERFDLTPDDAALLLETPEAFSVRHPIAPEFDELRFLAGYRDLRAMAADPEVLAGLLSSTRRYDAETDSGVRGTILDAVSAAMGWDRNELGEIVDHFGHDAPFNRIPGMLRLKAVFDLTVRLGSDVGMLIQLADSKNTKFEHYQQLSGALRDVLQSNHEGDAWTKASRAMHDELSVQARDALLSLAMLEIGAEFAGRRDPDLLYEYLLIDVQTGSEVDASRIQQAIASVQLYVQRCLMNLELGVKPESLPSDQWEWMKNYRVWEANRKVFLFPENFIEPELRDTKTPSFEELEQELMQSDIDAAAVESAYVNYLDRFTEVANLKVVGSYLHREGGDEAATLEETLYLVGRTPSDPTVFYYREHLRDRHGGRWLPWRKIDHAIKANFVTPVFAFGKLFLFWPDFTKIRKTVERRASEHLRNTYGVTFLNEVFTKPVTDAEIAALTNQRNEIRELIRLFPWLQPFYQPHLDAANASLNAATSRRNRQQAARRDMERELTSDEMRRLDERRIEFDNQGYLFNKTTGAREQAAIDVYNTTIRYTYLNLSGAWVQPQVYAELENELSTETYRRPEWQRLYAQQTVQLVTKSGGERTEESVRVVRVRSNTEIQVGINDLDTTALTWALWAKFEHQAPGGWPGWHFDFVVPPGTDPQEDLEAFARQLVDLTPTEVAQASVEKTVSLLDYGEGRFLVSASNVLIEVEGSRGRVTDAIAVGGETRAGLTAVNAKQFTTGASRFDTAATQAAAATFQKASSVAARSRDAAASARTAQETVDLLEQRRAEGADDTTIELLERAVAQASTTARQRAEAANDEAQLARVLEQLQPRWKSSKVAVSVGTQGEMTMEVAYDAWQHISLTLHREGLGYAAALRVFDNASRATSSIDHLLQGEALPEEGELRVGVEDGRGNSIGKVDPFVAHMSDVRLWSTALTTAEIAGGRHTRLRGQEPRLAVYLPLNVEPSGSTVELVPISDLEFFLPPVQLVRERIILIYGHDNTVKSIRNNLDDKSIVLDLIRSENPVLHDLMLSRETGVTLESSRAMLHRRATNGLEFRDYAAGDPTTPILAPLNASPSATERANYLVHRLKEAESSFMDVHNRPGWVILDSGDEQFLVKAVYPDGNDPTVGRLVPTTRDRMQVTFSDEGGSEAGTPQALSVSFVPVANDPLDGSGGDPVFTFERLSTFHVHRLSENLFTGGIDKLLSLSSQELADPEVDFQAVYDPNPNLIPAELNKLRSSIDFRGAYRDYYEEVFFHIPFLIANQLNANQRFSEAQKWYHYIFNPTARSDGTPTADRRDRYWQYLPFRRFSDAENLIDFISDEAALAEYRQDPFDPHAIARLRVFAYQKAVVMKYIDNLLDWGDAQFSQDTRESINEAVSLYVMAFNLLGTRPRAKTVRNLNAIGDYAAVRAAYAGSGLPDFIVEVNGKSENGDVGSALTTFCTVENEQFLSYWDRVEDRLFKIRHSLNIEGVFRQLALFEPPIDPAALVRAVAGGRDIGSALSDLAVPVPHYRYAFMLEKAKDVIGNVIELGGALLSALASRDAEQLAVLENTHERNVLEMMTAIKEQERDEAVTAIEALTKSREAMNAKYTRLGRLVDENLSPEEKAAIILFGVGNGLKIASSVLKFASSIVYTVPDVTAGGAGAFGSPVAVTTFGGGKIAEGLSSAADVVDIIGSATVLAGDITEKVAVYNRRRGEWEHERALAKIGLEEIDLQLEMAQLRRARAEQEIAIHAKTVEQKREVGDFHRRKFSNHALYSWMVGKVSGLYFQGYQLAFDMAKSAEKALQYELPTSETFINFGHWDSLKKGLLAGEALRLEVARMEKSHLEQDSRFLELEKTISLAATSPDSLDLLISNGNCEFDLTEVLFDRDHPGHYFRVIKTVAVSVVAAPGAVESINATLTQLGSRALLVPDENGVRYLLGDEGADQPPANVLRANWRANQQIAISKTSEDSGMFVLNFFLDDRYFPFEGTGAVSSWLLDIPHGTNPGVDFAGIQDVLIHLRYTAKSDGGAFKNAVMGMI